MQRIDICYREYAITNIRAYYLAEFNDLFAVLLFFKYVSLHVRLLERARVRVCVYVRANARVSAYIRVCV